jgi:type II secretory pathway component PulF
MLFTPGHFSRRADFYHQLGQLTSAGLGVSAALQQLHRAPSASGDKRHLASALADLQSGFTLGESFSRRADWLPRFDLALLYAGERSGRLDATFQMLSEFYQDRAAMARRMLGALAYPVFLLHCALFILPIPELFQTGNLAAYLLKIAAVLVPVYALTIGAVFASQGRRGEVWRSAFEKITSVIPLVGSGRRQLALARFAAALEALINAGESIVESLPLAAAASGSPALCREMDSWRRPLAAGKTPADILLDSTFFPETFRNLYSSGEISGSLDETLRRLHRYYAEEGSRDLHSAARIGPGIIYGLIVAYIAWRVIQFWLGYFNQLNQVIGG